ncbi:hypothetical protein [Streptomyces sp. MH60]|uniref:hypothetical protein n=1 Tax=Streptomyces sp. MH60 TaxID=1940758 RepID=UPI000D46C797|nr:hypothetical protein [Streptomyces sp. MH60]PPS90716.1 hypothetical protein BZZ08_00833 [Streptomyces sp. MH60]
MDDGLRFGVCEDAVGVVSAARHHRQQSRLSDTTFRRHFPDIVRDVADASQTGAPTAGTPQITQESRHLSQQSETTTGVTQIRPHRRR